MLSPRSRWQISLRQGMKADMGAMMSLCEKTDNDIRACINTLQVCETVCEEACRRSSLTPCCFCSSSTVAAWSRWTSGASRVSLWGRRTRTKACFTCGRRSSSYHVLNGTRWQKSWTFEWMIRLEKSLKMSSIVLLSNLRMNLLSSQIFDSITKRLWSVYSWELCGSLLTLNLTFQEAYWWGVWGSSWFREFSSEVPSCFPLGLIEWRVWKGFSGNSLVLLLFYYKRHILSWPRLDFLRSSPVCPPGSVW